jgi:hypothetical protein
LSFGKAEVTQSFIERQRSLILRQLARQIGSIDESIVLRVHGFSLEQLEALGEALLDFGSIEDCLAWLAAQG